MRQRSSFLAAFVRFHSQLTWITWVCVAFAISGLTCLAAGTRAGWFEWLFYSSALKTPGTVLGKSQYYSRRLGVYFTVRYEFRTAGAGASEGSDSVSGPYGDKLRMDESIAVFYLPKHPSHSRLSPGIRLGEAVEAVILLLVGALSTLLGLGAAVMVVSDRRSKYLKRRPAVIAKGQLDATPKS